MLPLDKGEMQEDLKRIIGEALGVIHHNDRQLIEPAFQVCRQGAQQFAWRDSAGLQPKSGRNGDEEVPGIDPTLPLDPREEPMALTAVNQLLQQRRLANPSGTRNKQQLLAVLSQVQQHIHAPDPFRVGIEEGGTAFLGKGRTGQAEDAQVGWVLSRIPSPLQECDHLGGS